MSRSRKNGLGFAKLFSGKGFAKPRLMFFKFGEIGNSARRVREECGRVFVILKSS